MSRGIAVVFPEKRRGGRLERAVNGRVFVPADNYLSPVYWISRKPYNQHIVEFVSGAALLNSAQIDFVRSHVRLEIAVQGAADVAKIVRLVTYFVSVVTTATYRLFITRPCALIELHETNSG
jgi:hypothetical protein